MIDKAPQSGLDVGDAELLSELQQSTPDAVRQARAHARITVRAKVIIQPGNVSQRMSLKLQGVSGDLSAGGCQLLVPLPLMVGDIYWLSFDRAAIDVAPMYARCLRCREVRSDAYEVGFAFFSKVDIDHLANPGRPSEAPLI